MTWEDVFFSRDIEPKDIIKALAHVFEVETHEIVIEYGWGWHEGLYNDRTAMLCRFDVIRGDFPIRLEIGFWSGWKRGVPQDSDRYTVVGRLCDLLSTPALVPGDASSPYIWALIHGEGDYQYVSLNGDKLDQPDELIELEIENELYKFIQNISPLEAGLGNLITRKNLIDADFQEYVMSMKSTSKDELLQALNNIRSEAKRMYREDLLQEAIDWVETSSHLPSNP